MAAISGKAALLKVSVTAGGAGTYTTVAGIKNPSIQFSGQNLDVTELPATYMARIQGLKDARISGSGTYQSGDTNGQVAIRNAFLNDSTLWYQYLPDGSTGWKQSCKVSDFTVESAVDGSVNLSFTLEGDGVVTAV